MISVVSFIHDCATTLTVYSHGYHGDEGNLFCRSYCDIFDFIAFQSYKENSVRTDGPDPEKTGKWRRRIRGKWVMKIGGKEIRVVHKSGS